MPDCVVSIGDGLIPIQKESQNFDTALYWNRIVPDRQGSAARKIINHWSPLI